MTFNIIFYFLHDQNTEAVGSKYIHNVLLLLSLTLPKEGRLKGINLREANLFCFKTSIFLHSLAQQP